MRRHYHIESSGDHDFRGDPITSFRAACSEAFAWVTQARAQRLWKSWRITWSDPQAGYRRWTGETTRTIGEYTDTITVAPCEEAHR